jgi:hypothetical protein
MPMTKRRTVTFAQYGAVRNPISLADILRRLGICPPAWQPHCREF